MSTWPLPGSSTRGSGSYAPSSSTNVRLCTRRKWVVSWRRTSQVSLTPRAAYRVVPDFRKGIMKHCEWSGLPPSTFDLARLQASSFKLQASSFKLHGSLFPKHQPPTPNPTTAAKQFKAFKSQYNLVLAACRITPPLICDISPPCTMEGEIPVDVAQAYIGRLEVCGTRRTTDGPAQST